MRYLSLLVVLGACHEELKPLADSPPDDPKDAGPDAGCGDNYTGEYVDWDSTEATFLGINAATFTVRTDTTRTATTAPNGRFVMCIPDGNFSVVDIAPPADYTPGLAFAKNDVARRAMPSMRSFTVAQRDAAFANFGVAFDANAGQVLVHFAGTTPHKATVGNTPAGSLARNADAWATGDTGNYVFFGNVALGATANVVVGSDATGAIGSNVSVPLSPGVISYVEIVVP